MLKHFLRWLLLFSTLTFAAAPVDLGGGGGGGEGAGEGAGGGEGEGGGEGDGAGDLGIEGDEGEGGEGGGEGEEDDLGLGEDFEDEEQRAEADRQRQRGKDDPDAAGFKGLVSRRIRALTKEAPGLTDIFKEHPKVQEQIEAAFRRDMGYRELGTIADFRSFREEFPGGMADVQTLRDELAETEQLDQDFYGRDQMGNYAGHTKIIQNLFNDDRAAAVALFRTVPKEWHRLDPDSYNEVMGNIVGATLSRSEVPEWIEELRDAAKAAKQDGIAASLDKLLRWSQGFLKGKPAPTEEERRLQAQRDQMAREGNERKQQDRQRFNSNLNTESHRLQQQIIRKHPAIAELLTTKNVTDQKKAEIIGKIQTAIQAHLKGSRAFMRKYKAAWMGSDMKQCIDLQKAQWSYPWVLNKFVRSVLATETPNLVGRNRERGRVANAAHRQPVNRGNQGSNNNNRGGEQKHTQPYKEGNVWYSKEGRRLTTSEILRGAVPDHLLNAK